MISSFQAAATAILVVLPGALYLFSYERIVGTFGVTLADRAIRFLAASCVIQAMFSPLTYFVYSKLIRNGNLAAGTASPWLVAGVAAAYTAIPLILGSLVGTGSDRRWRVASLITGKAPDPRAWDFVWRRKKGAILRLRMKSGRWLGGIYGTVEGRSSYASGYPEPGDLFLSRAVQVDPSTGEFLRGVDGSYLFHVGNPGLLLRWEDVEYVDYREVEE